MNTSIKNMMNEVNNVADKNVRVYHPVGSSERVQREISKKLAVILALNHGATLKDVGYLGATVLSTKGNKKALTVKLYFRPELCVTQQYDEYGEPVLKINNALCNMEGYMFVGPVDKTASIENVLVPKHKIKTRDDGTKYLEYEYNNDGKLSGRMVEQECVTITCNPDMVFAMLVNTSLKHDTDFAIHAEPVKRAPKASDKVIKNESSEMVPATVEVSYGVGEYHYDPNEALPYLMECHRLNTRKVREAELASDRARKEAKDKKRVKEAEVARSSGDSKYRKIMAYAYK